MIRRGAVPSQSHLFFASSNSILRKQVQNHPCDLIFPNICPQFKSSSLQRTVEGVRVSWEEEESYRQSKPVLTQWLPQEGSEHEIPKVHAETDPPACVRETQKTHTSPPRALREHSCRK